MDVTTQARAIDHEMRWLSAEIDYAIAQHFSESKDDDSCPRTAPPDLSNDPSQFAELIGAADLSAEQRLIFALALAPHIEPQLLDPFLIQNSVTGRGFSEFGGHIESRGGFVPSLETALFLLSVGDPARRLAALRLLDHDSVLVTEGFVQPLNDVNVQREEQRLRIDADRLSMLTTGRIPSRAYRADFPARPLTTRMQWTDLVLNARTRYEIEEVLAWVKHGATLSNTPGLGAMIRPGYRGLFYGPPGTGKTLTAALLGKATGREVYAVDLSIVVSKWIGETEKNLAAVFDQAERHDWILFFDEADAIFGKRTTVTQSNDRHANQEVSFILQRMEVFRGLMLVASNLRDNIDAAFSRRFETVVRFPVPGPKERLALWQHAMGNNGWLADDLDLAQIATQYELTGASIANVVRYCALDMLRNGKESIESKLLMRGIAREMRKDGKLQEVQ